MAKQQQAKRGRGRPTKQIDAGVVERLGDVGSSRSEILAYFNRLGREVLQRNVPTEIGKLLKAIGTGALSALKDDEKINRVERLEAVVKALREEESKGLQREAADRQHATMTTTYKVQ